jgi:hypothetical protein
MILNLNKTKEMTMTPLNMTREQKKELRELDKREKQLRKYEGINERIHSSRHNAADKAFGKALKAISGQYKKEIAFADREFSAGVRAVDKQLAAIDKRRNVLLGRLS